MNNAKWGLIKFLAHLKTNQICFHLEKPLPDSVLIEIAFLNQKIEIEFTNHGEILIEKFESTIRNHGKKTLEQLFHETNIDNVTGETIKSSLLTKKE
jgi:hypothetical protein